MGSHRYRFAEEDGTQSPPSVWMTRAAITALIVGVAGFAHIFYGFKFI